MSEIKTIQSLVRAFSILELYIGTNKNDWTINEISEALNLNKSTVYGLVDTLIYLGYLQKNKDKKIILGLKFLAYQKNIPLSELLNETVEPYMDEISNKFSESANSAILLNGNMLYLDKVSVPGSVIVNNDMNGSQFLHCTGLGKCLLAFSDNSVFEYYSKNNTLKKMTKNTITDINDLKNHLEKIKLQGYAVDDEELSIGLKCYAVPVFTQYDELLCAISISGVSKRIERLDEEELISELKKTSENITKNMFKE